jgi:hypothetical protein
MSFKLVPVFRLTCSVRHTVSAFRISRTLGADGAASRIAFSASGLFKHSAQPQALQCTYVTTATGFILSDYLCDVAQVPPALFLVLFLGHRGRRVDVMAWLRPISTNHQGTDGGGSGKGGGPPTKGVGDRSCHGLRGPCAYAGKIHDDCSHTLPAQGLWSQGCGGTQLFLKQNQMETTSAGTRPTVLRPNSNSNNAAHPKRVSPLIGKNNIKFKFLDILAFQY